jgi:hypothetical protein
MKFSETIGNIVFEIYVTIIVLAFALTGSFLTLFIFYNIAIFFYAMLISLFIGWVYLLIFVELLRKYDANSIINSVITKDFKR